MVAKGAFLKKFASGGARQPWWREVVQWPKLRPLYSRFKCWQMPWHFGSAPLQSVRDHVSIGARFVIFQGGVLILWVGGSNTSFPRGGLPDPRKCCTGTRQARRERDA